MMFKNISRSEQFLLYLLFVFVLVFVSLLFFNLLKPSTGEKIGNGKLLNNTVDKSLQNDVGENAKINKNFKEYFFKEYNLHIYYPSDYLVVEESKMNSNSKVYDYPTIRLENKKKNINLYIGDSAIFSTSSDICNPYRCDEVPNLSTPYTLTINKNFITEIQPRRRYLLANQDEILKAQGEVFEGSNSIIPDEKWEFKDYVFQAFLGATLSTDSRNYAYITANYLNKDLEEELIEIIKTFSW